MPTTTRPAAAVVLMVASLLALAGCSSPLDSQASGSAPSDININAPLPFDAYHLGDDELQQLQELKAKMLSTCAKRYGLTLTFGGDYIRPVDEQSLQWGGRFGTMTAAHAASYGYHPSPDGPWSPVGGFYIKDVSNMSPNIPPYSSSEEKERIMMVAYGPEAASESNQAESSGFQGREIPEGGCLQAVEDEIGTPLQAASFQLSDLINLSIKDERYSSAAQSWRDCMVTRTGKKFDGVQGAVESFALRAPSQEEVTTAVADVACTQESRWPEYLYAALAQNERRMISDNIDYFRAVLSSERSQLAKARALANL